MAGLIAVATSGGRDSTALLHATLRQAAALGLQVWALHVNHGLQAQADAWQTHVQRQCRRWARAGWPVQCLSVRLSGQPAAGDSIEAWARRERYRALTEMAQQVGAGLVLLAHHRRDQAETFLLQALRGGGAAGLAAMPREARRHGLVWARPWLDQPRSAIEAYIQRWRLSHVDDDSNADVRHDRNRLRHRVWPALLQAFPGAETALTQAASQAAQAATLMRELGAQDLAAAMDEGRGLNLQRWTALSPPRRRLCLHAFLDTALPAGVSRHLLERLLRELPEGRPGTWPAGAGGVLRAYRQVLRLECAELPQRRAEALTGEAFVFAPQLPGIQALPEWQGRLSLTSVTEGGTSAQWLTRLSARDRQGGEQFQATPGGIPRSLKKQYQAAAVPAWQRRGPLIWSGEQLLFVPGLGLDARCLAPAGQAQWALHWKPDTE